MCSAPHLAPIVLFITRAPGRSPRRWAGLGERARTTDERRCHMRTIADATGVVWTIFEVKKQGGSGEVDVPARAVRERMALFRVGREQAPPHAGAAALDRLQRERARGLLDRRSRRAAAHRARRQTRGIEGTVGSDSNFIVSASRRVQTMKFESDPNYLRASAAVSAAARPPSASDRSIVLLDVLLVGRGERRRRARATRESSPRRRARDAIQIRNL